MGARGIQSSPDFFTIYQLMPTMNTSATIFLFILAIAGQGACQADTLSPDGYQAIIAADGVQHVRIEGGSYFFKPSHVIVKINVPVELTVSVEKGLIPHTLLIQSPEAGIVVDEKLSSDAKTIRFTSTAVGEYPFYCNNKLLFFESHREKGIEGVFEVVE
jgi:plastocyanin